MVVEMVGSRSIRWFGMSLSPSGWGERVVAAILAFFPFLSFICIFYLGGRFYWEERVCAILFEMFYSEGTVYWYGRLIIGGGTQCATRSLLLLERERAKTRAGLEVGGEEREVQEVAYIIIISQAIVNGSDTSQGSGCCMIDIT